MKNRASPASSKAQCSIRIRAGVKPLLVGNGYVRTFV
jgi:hypothetical protein